MRHVVIFGSLVLILALLLLSMPIQSHDEPDSFAPRVVDGAVYDSGAVSCCSFEVDGRTRTCAIVAGQTCELCREFCGP